MKDVKISNIQFIFLLVSFIFGNSSVFTLGSGVSQDAWLAYILGWIAGLIIIGVIVYLAKLNQSKTLIGILTDSLGKYLGKSIALIYVVYFIIKGGWVLRTYGEFCKGAGYERTPLVFIISISALVLVYALNNGLEVLARANELLAPLLVTFTLVVTVLLIPEFTFDNFLPVFESSLGNILISSSTIACFPFGEVMVFLMIFPYMANEEKLVKFTYMTTIIIGFVIFISILRDLLVLGPELIDITIFPTNIVVGIVPSIQIQPPLLTAVYLIGCGIKAYVYVFAAITAITEIFGFDDYKPLVIPVTTLNVVIGMWIYDNVFEMLHSVTRNVPYIFLIFQFIIPVIMLIITIVKKQNKKQTIS
ncbi:MAG: hypothetical protein FH751_12370 [Firmicutes bacterium]|nr:hypothetical protein [Bacillota bacterium]